VFDELGSNVHSKDLSAGTYLLGEDPSKETCSRPDVGYGHPGSELAGRDDLQALGKNLPAFYLKLAGELFNVGLLEGLVDARTNALLLGRSGTRRSHEARQNQHES